ncbi:hypothetical protein ACSPJ8_002413 [Klebsiella aerogenes]|uniref:hypothetical protein n=1 Tax=Klebsiella aerogenes TaxID=548 RepID=UPI0031F2BEA2|nr:hypothetical protein [Klebsiella aerogenes]
MNYHNPWIRSITFTKAPKIYFKIILSAILALKTTELLGIPCTFYCTSNQQAENLHMNKSMLREQLDEKLHRRIEELKELVVDAADDRDGEFLGYPMAFAYAMNLIRTKATKTGMNFISAESATDDQIQSAIKLVDECIADWKAQNQ